MNLSKPVKTMLKEIVFCLKEIKLIFSRLFCTYLYLHKMLTFSYILITIAKTSISSPKCGNNLVLYLNCIYTLRCFFFCKICMLIFFFIIVIVTVLKHEANEENGVSTQLQFIPKSENPKPNYELRPKT